MTLKYEQTAGPGIITYTDQPVSRNNQLFMKTAASHFPKMAFYLRMMANEYIIFQIPVSSGWSKYTR